jgi:hypothetical protein
VVRSSWITYITTSHGVQQEQAWHSQDSVKLDRICTTMPHPCVMDHHAWVGGSGDVRLRVRVEIMGPGKHGNVGKSQPVLIMINPMIFTRTRTIPRRPAPELCAATQAGGSHCSPSTAPGTAADCTSWPRRRRLATLAVVAVVAELTPPPVVCGFVETGLSLTAQPAAETGRDTRKRTRVIGNHRGHVRRRPSPSTPPSPPQTPPTRSSSAPSDRRRHCTCPAHSPLFRNKHRRGIGNSQSKRTA